MNKKTKINPVKCEAIFAKNISPGQKNKYNIFILITVMISAGMFFSLWQKSDAQVSSIANGDLTLETEKAQKEKDEKLKELENRAEVYREIISIKQKQSETLSNQLSIADSSIAHVQAQIDVSKQEIDDFNSQISRIERQIKEKNDLIDAQRDILAKLMQSYYEINIASPVISYLSDGNLASFIVKKDRIAQVGDKVKEMVDAVKAAKLDFETKGKEIEEKKVEVVLTNEKLKAQNNDLESVKAQKETLIAQTNGEEARYSQLLARVELQKQELLDIDQLFLSGNFSIGGLSAGDYIEKNQPSTSLFASTSWYYSQKDPKWANMNIGNSSSDMKNWGCAVTSVAMVAKYNGNSITPGQLAKKPIFSFDLINWNLNAWSESNIALASTGSAHRNISWSTVDASIKNKIPVIVYIGKTGGSGGHYVVIHNKDSKTGKYVVHDPYFGPNLYLDTTRALIGAGKTNTGTYIDQMIIYNK